MRKLILIIAVLSLAVSTSVLIKAQPLQYGMELHEFDPYFNYRATQYLIDNGYDSYVNWQDDMSWYPQGRDISSTAQIMLHVTAGYTYEYVGQFFVQTLYEYVIIFPLIVSAVSVIVMFGLVRSLSSSIPALFSAFFFAIAVPITLRGLAGWFKSEPLGILFGLIALWLVVLAIKHRNKFGIISSGLAGIILVLGMSAWGGSQFFVVITSLALISLPFISKSRHNIIISGLIFGGVFLTSFGFERLPPVSLVNFALLFPFIFNIVAYFANSNKVRALILFAIIISVPVGLYINDTMNIISLPSYRYLNAINPTMSHGNPLVDSVAEHGGVDFGTFVSMHSLLFGLAIVGGYFILRKTKLPIESKMFVFIITGTSIYLGLAFVRLGVFTSIGLVIMGGIGLGMMLLQMKPKLRIRFIPVFVILILFTMFAPGVEWASAGNFPALILTGGTAYQQIQPDWIDALDWIKNNTAEDSVIVSWWDYGYWIQTKGERTTTTDNATLLTSRIEETAQAMLSPPEQGRQKMSDMGGDYFLTFVSFVKVTGTDFYVLQGGGDESKVYWFAKIAGVEDMVSPSNTLTKNFYDNTLLAYTFPFEHVGFVTPDGEIVQVQKNPSYYPVFQKVQRDGLVYASPSFYDTKDVNYGVFIYDLRGNG